MLRQANEPLQGVDVAPAIRAGLAGDADAIPPDLAGALAAWMTLFHPDVEIDTSRVDMPGFGVFRGFEGILKLFGRWIEEWDHYSWTHSNFSDAGDHVILDADIHATGTSSGVEVDLESQPDVHVWEGKVVRWCVFKDRASALAATEDSVAQVAGPLAQDAHADS